MEYEERIEMEKLRKDAERMRWILDGNGYYMEENGLCGHACDENEKDYARSQIDAEMKSQLEHEQNAQVEGRPAPDNSTEK